MRRQLLILLVPVLVLVSGSFVKAEEVKPGILRTPEARFGD